MSTNTIPVFTYYMLLQSKPANGPDEGPRRTSRTLTNTATMKLNTRLEAPHAEVRGLRQDGRRHVEPDIWGTRAIGGQSGANSAAGVPASVALVGVRRTARLARHRAGVRASRSPHARHLCAERAARDPPLAVGRPREWFLAERRPRPDRPATRSRRVLLTCGKNHGQPQAGSAVGQVLRDHLDREPTTNGRERRSDTVVLERRLANFRSYLAQVSQRSGSASSWKLPLDKLLFTIMHNRTGTPRTRPAVIPRELPDENTAISEREAPAASASVRVEERGPGRHTAMTREPGSRTGSIPANNIGNNATLSADERLPCAFAATIIPEGGDAPWKGEVPVRGGVLAEPGGSHEVAQVG